MFSNAGHETLVASNADEAWDTLQQHMLVDMAVLDNQLDQEWGWQFLKRVRSSSAFKGLPVVVYTANIERNTFAHYAIEGVQSMHVKPYQSDVILGELKKALDTRWTEKVMEPAEAACARLKISPEAYSSLLASAIRSIEERLTTAKKRIASPNDRQLFSSLEGIAQQCRALGITVVDGEIAKIKKSVDAQDTAAALEGLRFIESIIAMMRQRMLEVLKMQGAIAKTKVTLSPEEEKAFIPEPPANFAAAYGRDMINKPLWQFGTALQRLMGHRLFTDEELGAFVKRVGVTPPMVTLCACLDLMERSSDMKADEALRHARETRSFAMAYRAVLEKVTGANGDMNAEARLQRAVVEEGPVKVLTMLSMMRMAEALPRGGILGTRQLNVHNLAVPSIALEAGRLLKLANINLLAAAGLAQGSGRWLFAYGEPGVCALGLALAESKEISVEEAQRSLFGVDQHEAGRRLLAEMGRSALLQETAAFRHDPAKVKEKDFMITVCVVHMAYLLAQAVLKPSAVETKAILSRLREKEYPAWTLLRRQDVSLAFEESEIIDTLAEVASTSVWIAGHFLTVAERGA